MVRHAALKMVSETVAPEQAERSFDPPPVPCAEPAPKIVYFAQDLADPAVRKRVRMLRAGGATVSVFGFQRGAVRLDEADCERVVDLGRTFDGRLVHRARAVARAVLRLRPWRAVFRDADIFMARNLEMLVIADRARRYAKAGTRFVYECLDIHSSLVGEGARARMLRAAEWRLLAKCDRLVVSSPAFLDRHFRRYRGIRAVPLVVENKVLSLTADASRLAPSSLLPAGPPWRIGWFGIIRAQKALDLLCAIAERNKGLVEIVIRGQPALRDFHDFSGQVERTPGVTFHGPYEPSDLPAIYGAVHFIWAFDYLDEGRNSAWLLPNRVYEGGQQGAVALASATTETGRWLKDRGSGVLFEDPLEEIGAFLRKLSPDAYGVLRHAAKSVPRADVVADQADCEALVSALAGRGAQA